MKDDAHKVIPIGRLDDFEEGQSVGFLENEEGQDTFFVIKAQGQLFAWLNACPHVNGAPMAWRKNAYMNGSKTHIVCHAHGALFEPTTGLCIQGPCRGQFLSEVNVLVDQAGEASVRLVNCSNNKNKG